MEKVNGVDVVSEMCLDMGPEGAELTKEPLVILPSVIIDFVAGLAVFVDDLKRALSTFQPSCLTTCITIDGVPGLAYVLEGVPIWPVFKFSISSIRYIWIPHFIVTLEKISPNFSDLTNTVCLTFGQDIRVCLECFP